MEYLKCKVKETQNGITLISLVITIIILLILARASIAVLFGNHGLITKARKATFYAEMQAINEHKDVSKISNFMYQGDADNVEASFLDKKVPVNNVKEFSNTLKAEIIFARSNFGKGEMLETKKIWKENLYNCQDAFADEWIEGIANEIYYISKNATNYEEKYIYDQVTDMCYKIEDTKIGSHVVHSLEYAQFIIDGVNSNGIGIVDTETGIMNSSDGTQCYEPDLNNFSYKTDIIYYSENMQQQYTMPVKEFIEKGKPVTTEVEGQKYIFANYSSTGTSVWANIKCSANTLESYWVWIPRFAYKLDSSNSTSNIIFIDLDNKQMNGAELPEGYEVHELFKENNTLKGIWFSKYQPSPLETISIDNTEPEAPNLSNFKAEDTKLIYYTSDGNENIEVDYSENPNQAIEKDGKMYYFYNYKNKIWANIKCSANGIESYWVWIPRFAYKLESGESSVILIDNNNIPIDKETYGNSLPSGYKVHEAFKQQGGLKGMWFSKYQPTAFETAKTNKNEPGTPNLSNFKAEDTKLIYYTSDGNENIEVDYSPNPSQTIEKNGKTYYFYNYINKVWANVKCTANGLESYWVWIPRFAYKIESGTTNVILIDESDKPIDTKTYGNSLPNGYKVHEAFTQQSGLKGIWFSKYQPSKSSE